MTLFDMIALGLLALSGFAGFSKGGVREMVGFVGFTLALVIAAYALPWSAPVVRRFVHPAWAGACAALVAGFVLSFMIINLLGDWVGKQIDNSAFGAFDRAIGLGLGLVRGLVVLGLFVLAVGAIVPRQMTPKWITDAKLYPLARATADIEAALAPKGFAFSDKVTTTVTERVKSSF
jgi:membrane protein required for colicin V production